MSLNSKKIIMKLQKGEGLPTMKIDERIDITNKKTDERVNYKIISIEDLGDLLEVILTPIQTNI